MQPPLGIIVVSYFLIIAIQVNTESTYRAAVVEYAVAKRNTNQTEEAYLLTNANKMIGLIEKAKSHNADIIVFPEFGTMAGDNISITVPDPEDKIIPADNSSYSEILSMISNAARTSQIYIVINVNENFTKFETKIIGNFTKLVKKTMYFDTNVAFDRNGTVIARYRKYNTYNQNSINTTSVPELSYFDTDFGVRFGMFVGIDILFEKPAMDLVRNYNISHFAYSTAWVLQLPFMTGIQAQNGFAYGNDVIVLASGLNDISQGRTGSGIFRGKYGKTLAWQTYKEGTTLIIGDVPVSGDFYDCSEDLIDDSGNRTSSNTITFEQEDMSDYNTKLISPLYNTSIESIETIVNGVLEVLQKSYVIQEQLCDGNLCCSFNISLINTYLPSTQRTNGTSSEGCSLGGYLYYRMAVSNGTRGFDGAAFKLGQQICGIISCTNDTVNSCGRPINGTEVPPYVDDPQLGKLFLNSTIFTSVKITGNFTNRNVLPTLSILRNSDSSDFSDTVKCTENSTTIIVTSNTSAADNLYQLGKLIQNSNLQFTDLNNTSSMNVSLEFKANQLVSGGIFVRAYDWDQLNRNGSSDVRPSIMFFSNLATMWILKRLFTVRNVIL